MRDRKYQIVLFCIGIFFGLCCMLFNMINHRYLGVGMEKIQDNWPLDIQPIIAIPLPYSVDEKIFNRTDEDGEVIGKPYSYNEWIEEIKNISGVNESLLGKEGE